MKKVLFFLFISLFASHQAAAQNYGDIPTISKDKLLNDLELLYQGLDKFHSGMYWYTPKDSVDTAFQEVREQINRDLNVLEFHKLIAPLVALSREDHTDIFRPKGIYKNATIKPRYLPLTFVFLGKELYCVKNASADKELELEGKQVESINGESPAAIVSKIGNLFASDGYIKTVKYNDLEGFNFSKYYFYYYGLVDQFEIKFKDIKEPVILKPLSAKDIFNHLRDRYKGKKNVKDLLEYEILNDSTAYLGVHSFSNDRIKDKSQEKDFKTFLQNSFKSIKENNIKTLIVDVSKNGGGTEGNEGLLYSYLGENYKKYKHVKAKTQKAVLDNGVDKPITLKTFGFLEKVLFNRKNDDGSYQRKEGAGHGLMAYKKEPEHKFSGKVYVIISPLTYSGGSEFSNMMYTNDVATFVGQETGGGYLGNTSGYGEELELPNSKITIDIPALQFLMNVEAKLPFGSGVIPHHEVIPTFTQYINGENAALKYILEVLEGGT